MYSAAPLACLVPFQPSLAACYARGAVSGGSEGGQATRDSFYCKRRDDQPSSARRNRPPAGPKGATPMVCFCRPFSFNAPPKGTTPCDASRLSQRLRTLARSLVCLFVIRECHLCPLCRATQGTRAVHLQILFIHKRDSCLLKSSETRQEALLPLESGTQRRCRQRLVDSL